MPNADPAALVWQAVDQAIAQLRADMVGAAYTAGSALQGSMQQVLSGGRSGRRYFTRTGAYTASAPGEPPASRTGALRQSWQASVAPGADSTHIQLTSYSNVAALLEQGSARIAPRPHAEAALQAALPSILAAFDSIKL